MLDFFGISCDFTDDIHKAKKFRSFNGEIDIIKEDLKNMGFDFKKSVYKNYLIKFNGNYVIEDYKEFLEVKKYYTFFSNRKGMIKNHHKIIYNVLKSKSVYNGFSISAKNNAFDNINNAINVIKKSLESDIIYKEINIVFGYKLGRDRIKEIIKIIMEEINEGE